MTADDDFDRAAQLLRGLKERVDRLEDKSQSGDLAALFRQVEDSALASDEVTVEVDDTPGWVWGESEWDFAEWTHEDADGHRTATYDGDDYDSGAIYA